MSEGNIIRSKNHSVTIEKGSKNAKARSAHLEEGFDLLEGAPSTPEEEQIFQNQIHVETDAGQEEAGNLGLEGGASRTMAQKMADLNSQMRSVNESLDGFQAPSSSGVKGADQTLSGALVQPNVQNITDSGSLASNKANIPGGVVVPANLQEVNAVESLGGTKATLPPAERVGANLQNAGTGAVNDTKAALPDNGATLDNHQGLGAQGITDSKATLGVDVSNRPRLRGAAAMDALKEAKARLAQAAQDKPNLQDVPTTDALQDEHATLPEDSGFGSNVQNVPASPVAGTNRAALGAGKSSKNVQDIMGQSAQAPNRAPVSDDSAQDNHAKLPAGAVKNAKAAVPTTEQGGVNKSAVQSAGLKSNLAQVPGAKGHEDNNAQIGADSSRDNHAGIEDGSIKDNRANLPHDSASSNKAPLPHDAEPPHAGGVPKVDAIKDNLQGVPNPGVNSNQAGADKSHQEDNLAQIPHGAVIEDNEAQIPISGIKHNQQDVSTPLHGTNHAEVEQPNTAGNPQGVEDAHHPHNHAHLPGEDALDNSQGVASDDLDPNTAGIAKHGHEPNTAQIPVAGQQDNVAEVPVNALSDNVAEIERDNVQVHREPLPEGPTGAANPNTDLEGLSVGSAQGHAHTQDSGGRIHQTHPNAVSPSPSGHLNHGQGQDGSMHPAPPDRAPQALKPKTVAARAGTQAPTKAKKPGVPAGGAAARPKEVPKASDTWSEAFRGRVAAINDQVKSLNHKLDDFDK